MLRAAARYDESEPVNIGTGSEIKISELLQTIVRLTRFEGEIRWQHDKPDGQPRRRLDVSRAFEKFGFQAQVPFEEGLRRTIEWYETTRAVSSTGDESSRGNRAGDNPDDRLASLTPDAQAMSFTSQA